MDKIDAINIIDYKINNGFISFLKSKIIAYNEALDINDNNYINNKSIALKSAFDTVSIIYNLIYKESYSKDKKHIENVIFYKLGDLDNTPILKVSK